MKAIIIDDENRARVSLQLLIQEYCPTIEIVAECENLSEGVKAIRRTKPDIVFLDIEMPGHSGLELLDFFNEDEVDFAIIFTTAYNEYAVRAFKLSALDYLLKPINPADLTEAVQRAEKIFNKQERYQVLKENFSKDCMTKIAVPSGTNLIFLNIADIIYIKANGAYSEIIKKDGTMLMASKNLKNFEELLQHNNSFYRVHKSYIVNCEMIDSLTKSDGGNLLLKNTHNIPFSTDKFDTLLERIKVLRK